MYLQICRRRVADALSFCCGRTHLVHLASSFPIERCTKIDVDVSGNEFLYVGGRNSCKNFSFLLSVMEVVVSGNPSIKLLVAGAPSSIEERN